MSVVKAEAERNKVFAAAFEKDPEFFSFYRTMKAYEKSLTDSGTTLAPVARLRVFQVLW